MMDPATLSFESWGTTHRPTDRLNNGAGFDHPFRPLMNHDLPRVPPSCWTQRTIDDPLLSRALSFTIAAATGWTFLVSGTGSFRRTLSPFTRLAIRYHCIPTNLSFYPNPILDL